jgi:predicted metal-dependent phosphoesterase TrpH
MVGEEIVSSEYHLLAVGIREAISSRQPASSAIDEVHRQGGVAIAAHPYEAFRPGYDDEAVSRLDGTEVVRPESMLDETLAAELREFYGRGTLTAIGSSDYHGCGLLGRARTFVFARERTEQGVVDAVRDGRTVVYDRTRVYGDPAMIELARDAGLDPGVPELPVPGAARFFSRLAAVVGLLAAFLFNRW